METLEKIRKAYTDYVLEYGKQPTSVFQFVKKLKIAEADFYKEYTSFDAIEADAFCRYLSAPSLQHLAHACGFQDGTGWERYRLCTNRTHPIPYRTRAGI